MPAPNSQSLASVVDLIAPALLTTAQAAEYLSIKPATLAVWRSTNRVQLPFVKLGGSGGQVRYRRADLDAFINYGLRNAP